LLRCRIQQIIAVTSITLLIEEGHTCEHHFMTAREQKMIAVEGKDHQYERVAPAEEVKESESSAQHGETKRVLVAGHHRVIAHVEAGLPLPSRRNQ
jgi:hypothetical protein